MMHMESFYIVTISHWGTATCNTAIQYSDNSIQNELVACVTLSIPIISPKNSFPIIREPFWWNTGNDGNHALKH